MKHVNMHEVLKTIPLYPLKGSTHKICSVQKVSCAGDKIYVAENANSITNSLHYMHMLIFVSQPLAGLANGFAAILPCFFK